MRQRRIEPGSIAWKATTLTFRTTDALKLLENVRTNYSMDLLADLVEKGSER